MTDAVVIGGGPAGAACALWMHQLGLQVMLLEAASAIGGLQTRSPYTNRWLPGLPGKTGRELAAQLQAHLVAEAVPHALRAAVVSVRRDALDGVWEVASAEQTWRARRVVIATGAVPRTGGFSESENVGIGPGISMERIPVQGRRVAILGGGDNAFDMAAFALGRGARSVDVYCRREPHAQPMLRRQVSPHNLHVGPFAADPQSMTVNAASYDVLGVQFGFEACVPAGLALPLRHGLIEVDRCGAVCGVPDLFAAGEVTGFWHPCVATAFAHGVQVAKSIQQALMAECSGAGTAAGAVSQLLAA